MPRETLGIRPAPWSSWCMSPGRPAATFQILPCTACDWRACSTSGYFQTILAHTNSFQVRNTLCVPSPTLNLIKTIMTLSHYPSSPPAGEEAQASGRVFLSPAAKQVLCTMRQEDTLRPSSLYSYLSSPWGGHPRSSGLLVVILWP